MRAKLPDVFNTVWIERMIVFTLCKKHLAERATAVHAAHFLVEYHKGVVFGKHIDSVTALSRTDECNALCHSTVRDTLAQYVDVLLKRSDCKRSMLVKIVADENGVHSLMLYKIIEIKVGSNVSKSALCGVEVGLPYVADRHDLSVVDQNVVKKRLSSSCYTKNSYSYFFHGNSFPKSTKN